MNKAIFSDDAPKAIGPYSHAVTNGKMIFTSGQLGIDAKKGVLGKTVEEQTELAILNVKAVLTSDGFTLKDVIKTTVFIADMNDFAAVNSVYAKYFTEPFPARSCVEVARLPKDGLVEIEVIAAK